MSDRCPHCDQALVLSGEWLVDKSTGEFVFACDECLRDITRVPPERIAQRLTDGQIRL